MNEAAMDMQQLFIADIGGGAGDPGADVVGGVGGARVEDEAKR